MTIPKGYILLPRIFYDSEMAEKPPHYREIWQWFIQKANHTEIEINGQILKRGQLFTSYSTIREELKWYAGASKRAYKKHHVERALKYFKETTMVSIAKTTRGMVITIYNYDNYQTPGNYENDTDADNETISKTTRPRTLYTRIKEFKENTYTFSFFENLVNEVKEENNIIVEKEFAQNLFEYYSNTGWKFKNGNPIENEKHLRSIIKTSLQKPSTTQPQKPKSIIIGDLNFTPMKKPE